LCYNTQIQHYTSLLRQDKTNKKMVIFSSLLNKLDKSSWVRSHDDEDIDCDVINMEHVGSNDNKNDDGFTLVVNKKKMEREKRIYRFQNPKKGKTIRKEDICRKIFEDIYGYPFVNCKPIFMQGLEFDGYCEQLGIAFEYDGIQHFKPSDQMNIFAHGKFYKIQNRDRRKRKLAYDFGIRLYHIPFTVKTESLKFYIHNMIKFNHY
jgi:hypothetical protein